MRDVARIHPSERVDIDHGQLLAGGDRPFGPGADTDAGAALEDLAYWLYHFEAARQRADLAGLRAAAVKVARLADDIGLTTAARVARQAEALCGDAANPALAAVAARLCRIGDVSLQMAWDLQNVTV